MRAKRFVSWLAAATLVTGLLVAAGPTAPADPTGADLARGKPVTTSTAARAAATITDGTNVSISGARTSGDAFDAKSGFGIWVNEMPEPNQGPAVGSATFNNLTLNNNAQDIKNTTSTFTIVRN